MDGREIWLKGHVTEQACDRRDMVKEACGRKRYMNRKDMWLEETYVQEGHVAEETYVQERHMTE